MMNATDFALVDIAELERDGHISAAMAQRGRDLVELLFQDSTTYASIGPDDGDLLFYWRAGDRSVSIDLYDDGGGWYRVRRGEWCRTHDGGTPQWIYDALQGFSEHVELVNPAWRELRSDD